MAQRLLKFAASKLEESLESEEPDCEAIDTVPEEPDCVLDLPGEKQEAEDGEKPEESPEPKGKAKALSARLGPPVYWTLDFTSASPHGFCPVLRTSLSQRRSCNRSWVISELFYTWIPIALGLRFSPFLMGSPSALISGPALHCYALTPTLTTFTLRGRR